MFDDLLAVEVEVGEVQEQRVLVGCGCAEVPDLMHRETLGLGVHAERGLIGDEHRRGCVPPSGRFLGVDAEVSCRVRVAGRCFGRGA